MSAKIVNIVSLACAVSLAMAAGIAPAAAATANNSQAGAYGHTKNMEKSTVMDMQHMGRHHHRRHHRR